MNRMYSIPERDLTPGQAHLVILRELRKVQKELSTMTEEIRDLRTEVTAENEEDVLTAQTIADLNTKVDDLQSRLDEADTLVASAQAGEADALARLQEVLDGVREATEELRADNPAPEPEPTPEPAPDGTGGGDATGEGNPGDVTPTP